MASIIATIAKTPVNGPYAYDLRVDGTTQTVVVSKTLAASMNELRDLIAAQPGTITLVKISVQTS